jgi:hypothetical protein
MRDCPQCNSHVDGSQCPRCGYADPGAENQGSADPMHFRCENTAFGERCANLGTISHSTVGGGPWLCSRHFFGYSPARAETMTDSAAIALTDFVTRHRMP